MQASKEAKALAAANSSKGKKKVRFTLDGFAQLETFCSAPADCIVLLYRNGPRAK